MSVWRTGTSVLALATSGARTATVSGGPPPSDVHLTPGTGEAGMSVTLFIEWRNTENFEHQQVLFDSVLTGSGVSQGASTAYDPQTHAGIWFTTVEKVGDAAWGLSSYEAPLEGYAGQYRRGILLGRRTGIVHDTPGTYRATRTFIRFSDGARCTSTVLEYTIGDQNSLFTSAQTLIVDTTGSGTGAPANAGVFTTFQNAWNALLGSAQPRVRILFRRGQDFTSGGMASQASAFTPTTILIDTWGTGAKPLLAGQTWGTNVTNKDIRIANCELRGTWDGSNNTGTRQNMLFMAGGNDITFSNYDATDFGDNFADFGGNNLHTGISNCRVIGYSGSASITGNHTSFFVRGSLAQQRPNAWTMVNNSQGGGFGFRNGGATWLAQVSQCDFFMKLSNFFTTPSPFTSTQSAVRLQTVGVTGGAHLTIDRCRSEGGGFGVYSNSGSGNNDINPCTQTVCFNYVSGHMDYGFGLMNTKAGGIQIYNNVWVAVPSRPTVRGGGVTSAISNFFQFNGPSGGGSWTGGTQNDPMEWFSNTFISLQDGAAPGIASRDAGFTSTPLEVNNLRHHPYASSGAINAGAFGGEIVHIPKYIGYHSFDSTTFEPRTITPTHMVELSGATGTFNEGTTSTEVTLTAPGTVTAKVAQVQTTGGVTRLWLYQVTGTIASGATVSVSSGGSGTAVAAMSAAALGRAWQPSFAPGSDAGRFSRLTMGMLLQTAAVRGAWPQA